MGLFTWHSLKTTPLMKVSWAFGNIDSSPYVLHEVYSDSFVRNGRERNFGNIHLNFSGVQCLLRETYSRLYRSGRHLP